MNYVAGASLVAFALAVGSIAACGADPRSSSAGSTGADSHEIGKVGLDLTLPAGITINSVAYTLSGPTPVTGSVPLSNSSAIRFQVGGLTAGNYNLALTATDTSGDPCSGSSSFAVTAGSTTGVSLAMTCIVNTVTVAPVGMGSVSVEAGVNVEAGTSTVCPGITALTVTPSDLFVGTSTTVSVSTVGGNPTINWTQSDATGQTGAGTFASTSAASTTFTCTQAGQVLVNVSVATGACASEPFTTMFAVVTCEPSPAMCPATQPASGSACTSAGETCSYGSTSCQCTSGAWSCGTANLFASCSLSGGCLANCAPAANDPIATGNANWDQYDGCFLAGMQVAADTQPWQGQLLKSQAYILSGITPVITTNDTVCGGQNCGPFQISAGPASGDPPPGPCGSAASDPFTGQVDYSRSYGLFQATPACDGTFLTPTLPAGDTCTGTGIANNIPFGSSITFYCEGTTSLGVNTPTGAVKGYIDAVQSQSDPLYATSIFNPAYQLYVYLDHQWGINFQLANATATGCTQQQQWYLALAYYVTGAVPTTCALTGAGQQYVKSVLNGYQVLYNKAWPYPGP
jgi:hypothetical protein